jgi:hypothetical protein
LGESAELLGKEDLSEIVDESDQDEPVPVFDVRVEVVNVLGIFVHFLNVFREVVPLLVEERFDFDILLEFSVLVVIAVFD